MQAPPGWNQGAPQQGYPQQGYAQQGYPQGPQQFPQAPRRPPPAARHSAWRLGRIVMALVVAGLGITTAAVMIIVGTPIWFYNDGDTKAVLEVDEKKVTIAPHTWGKVNLRTNSSYDAKVTFDGGRTEAWKVNLTHRPDFPDQQAYALAGTGCFALLDVTKLYKNEQPPLKVIGTFKATHLLEQRVARSTVLDPGELPRKVVFNSSFDTIVWITPASCDALTDKVAIQKFESQLRPPIAKK